MSSNEEKAPSIRCRENGPYVIEGRVVIKDADGNVIPPSGDKPHIALCRCGHSESKPFCDGSHKKVGFVDPGR